MELETLPEHRCLGCSQFFYEASNVYDPSVSLTPLEVLETIKDFFGDPEKVKSLKATICAFLNSQGGVIMFDLHRFDSFFLAVGSRLKEDEKGDLIRIF